MLRTALRSLTQRLDRVDQVVHVAPGASPRDSHVRMVAVLAAACGAFMLSVALRQKGPTIHPDEFGFLTNGQVLIGHVEAQVPTGSFYPAGYGLVTGLAALVTGSIAGAYRLALVTNVVLAVAVGFAARRLAIRGFGVSPQMGTLAGLLTFVAPGTIVSAMFSWPETLARLAFIGLVGGVVWAARSWSARAVVILGAYAGLLPAMHGRFTLMLPVVCLVILWWGWRRDIGRIVALAAVGAAVAGYAVSYLMNKFVKDAVYGASYDQESRLLRRLANIDTWPALLRTMTGQSWYLLATSFGIVGIAVGWALWRARPGGGEGPLRRDPERIALLVMVACTAALVFTGGLQLLYGDRGDHLIYGRYVELLVPVLWVAALAAMEKATRVAQRVWFVSVGSIAGVAALYVLADGGDALKGRWFATRNVVFPNIVGTDFARYFVSPGLVTFALLFSGVGAVLWLLLARKGAIAPLAMVALLSVGGIVSGQRSILTRTEVFSATGVSLAVALSPDTERLGFDMGVRNDRAYYFLRYKMHPVLLDRFDVSSEEAVVPSTYRCIYGWADKPPRGGDWEVVAEEPQHGRVLFRRAESAGC